MCFVTSYMASKMKGSLATPVTGVLLLLCLHCFLVSCQAVQYDYNPTGPNGPAQWGNLNPPNWVQCSIGTNQSPIDITSVIPHPPTSLGLVYATTVVDAEIYNNGHTPTVEMVHPNSGSLTISGVTYYLEDLHFHIQSEHLISNHRFCMEMHLVHKSTSGQVAVVALLYTLGPANAFLSQFFGSLPSFTTPNVKTPIKITLPVIGLHPYFRYNGSLTTPPCAEIVVWTIIDHFPTLSTQQLQQLRAALPEENARPIQPKNGQTVYLFS